MRLSPSGARADAAGVELVDCIHRLNPSSTPDVAETVRIVQPSILLAHLAGEIIVGAFVPEASPAPSSSASRRPAAGRHRQRDQIHLRRAVDLRRSGSTRSEAGAAWSVRNFPGHPRLAAPRARCRVGRADATACIDLTEACRGNRRPHRGRARPSTSRAFRCPA